MGFHSIFADARNSAGAAINASNAYKNIVNAIDEAYNASLAAKEAGEDALRKVRLPIPPTPPL